MSPVRSAPFPPGSLGPVKDLSSVEVAAQTVQGQTPGQFQFFPFPELDQRVRVHDPGLIGRVKVDGRVEGTGPLHHTRIVVGVADGDMIDATRCLHSSPGILLQERDAIP